MRLNYRGKGKYGSERVNTAGHSFASKLEAAVYQILYLREKAGEIKILQTQDHIYLTAARIGYVPDFKCGDVRTGEIFWVEAKGYETPEWRIKRRLWISYGPGRLEIWKGSASNPMLSETIGPKGER